MQKCELCKSSTEYTRTAGKNVLKALKRAKPSATEKSRFCNSCYTRAQLQLKRYLEKINYSESELRSYSNFGSSSASSLDSLDREVYQGSLMSAHRRAQNREDRTRLSQSQRHLQLDDNRGRSSNREGHVIHSQNPVRQLRLDDSGVTRGNREEHTSSTSNTEAAISGSGTSESLGENIIGQVHRDDTFVRQDDLLPGVPPYIRPSRRTEVEFVDEELIPIYNQRTTGG